MYHNSSFFSGKIVKEEYSKKERDMKYIVVTAIMTLLTALPVAAQAYRWVDDKGQVHYSSQPPQNEKSEKIKMPTLPKLNDADVRAQEAAIAKQKEKEAKQANLDKAAQQKTAQTNEQLKKACEGMRKDLALYRSQPKVRVNVNGEARRLTSEELDKRISDLEKSIKTNCQDF